MFDELKNLVRNVIKGVRERLEPLEADVKEVKADLADLKAFRDELKNAGFGDLKSDLDALGGKDSASKPADPAPQPEAEAPVPEHDHAEGTATLGADVQADGVHVGEPTPVI